MNLELSTELASPTALIWVASFFSVLLSFIVLVSKNPVASAVALMGTLFSTAAIYFGLGNYFMGSVQILVYAGAIAVLFVFIVMLLDLKPSLLRFIPGRKIYVVATAVSGILLALLLLKSVLGAKIFISSPTLNESFQLSAHQISEFFISQYQIAFQAAGLLVFGAIIGAIVLARSHLKS